MNISDFIKNEQIDFPPTSAGTLKQYIGYTRGILPHLSYTNGLFFVTTRLADSVPQDVIDRKCFELQLIQTKERDTPAYHWKQRELWDFIQRYEDLGYGNCFLKQEKIATLVLDTLRFYNDIDYKLLAWTIMPNHIHLLIKMLRSSSRSIEDNHELLAKCIQKIKGYTAQKANELLGRRGLPFWQKDYFDRYIRNEQHLRNVVKYIINNPRKIHYTSEFTGTIFDDWKNDNYWSQHDLIK